MKEEKTKYLILECRYYNGEDDNPFDEEPDASAVWRYEQWYVENYPKPDEKPTLKNWQAIIVACLVALSPAMVRLLN